MTKEKQQTVVAKAREVCKVFVARVEAESDLKISKYGVHEPWTKYNDRRTIEAHFVINNDVTLRFRPAQLQSMPTEKFVAKVERKVAEWNEFFSGKTPESWLGSAHTPNNKE